MKISIFNPFSSKYEATKQFPKLKGSSQFGVIVLSSLAGLLTLPFGGLGGVAVFRKLTSVLPRKEQKVNEVATSIIQSKKAEPKAVTSGVALHQDGIEDVENDGKPAPIDILKIQSTDQLGDQPDVLPSNLTIGQSKEQHGTLYCGDKPLDFAAAVRARSYVELLDKNKPMKMIEDQLVYQTLEVKVNGQTIQTTFVLSNDGNGGNPCSLFYSQIVPLIFQRFMNEAFLEKESIDGTSVEEVMKRTMEEVERKWQDQKNLGSLTTTNMMLFFPDSEGNVKGAFYGEGDTRTIIIRDNNVFRLGTYAPNGENQGASTSHFDLMPGDLVFCSSDGIWHNASPNQVKEFLQTQLEAEQPLNAALHNLVNACTTPPARIDDVNPFLLRIPE